LEKVRQMHRLIFAIAGLLVLAASDPAVALGGGEAGELQAARLNALAGGPLSWRDKELLERWGCESGTPNCQALIHGKGYHRAHRRIYRH
jgi:hypothetical protein